MTNWIKKKFYQNRIKNIKIIIFLEREFNQKGIFSDEYIEFSIKMERKLKKWEKKLENLQNNLK